MAYQIFVTVAGPPAFIFGTLYDFKGVVTSGTDGTAVGGSAGGGSANPIANPLVTTGNGDVIIVTAVSQANWGTYSAGAGMTLEGSSGQYADEYQIQSSHGTSHIGFNTTNQTVWTCGVAAYTNNNTGTFVLNQSPASSFTGPANSPMTITPASSPKGGDLLVVSLGFESGSSPSVTDNLGNSFSLGLYTTANGLSVAHFYCLSSINPDATALPSGVSASFAENNPVAATFQTVFPSGVTFASAENPPSSVTGTALVIATGVTFVSGENNPTAAAGALAVISSGVTAAFTENNPTTATGTAVALPSGVSATFAVAPPASGSPPVGIIVTGTAVINVTGVTATFAVGHPSISGNYPSLFHYGYGLS